MGGGSGGLPSFEPGDSHPAVERRRTMLERRPLDGDAHPAAPRTGGRAIREIPAMERPRERLASRGVGGLSAAELIALLWGSGFRGRSAVDLAEDALAHHDGLTGLARASEAELDRLAGIGAARAAQLPFFFQAEDGIRDA